ncbi:MAG: 50S ribosomal protein L17 [Candidatus Pacebacteria bacterium]|nr:50S ribosomal protein L17 [Candidatus Paceibacterota bacterium]
MRHHDNKRKFGLERKVRAALMHGLAFNLLNKGRIMTTEAKAKEIRPYVEKLITHAKTDTLAKRRLVSDRLMGKKTITKKLFEEIAPKYKTRDGGYLRITKLPPRIKDSAKMAVIELV